MHEREQLERRVVVDALSAAKRLPPFERSLLKELVVQRDKRLVDLKPSCDAAAFRNMLLLLLIEILVDATHKIWDRLFERCSTETGKALAKTARDSRSSKGSAIPKPLHLLTSSLTYGECDFYSLASILEKVKPQQGERFYDLGSGTGRAVMVATLLYGHIFSVCEGIELLEDLVSASLEVQERYAVFLESEPDIGSKPLLSAIRERRISSAECCSVHSNALSLDGDAQPTAIRNLRESQPHSTYGCSMQHSVGCATAFYCGDLVHDTAWCNADVVFANSTCFNQPLMAEVARIARGMRPGSRIVTLTRPLEAENAFKLVEKKDYGMSWGLATCYTYERKQAKEQRQPGCES